MRELREKQSLDSVKLESTDSSAAVTADVRGVCQHAVQVAKDQEVTIDGKKLVLAAGDIIAIGGVGSGKLSAGGKTWVVTYGKKQVSAKIPDSKGVHVMDIVLSGYVKI